MKNTHNVRRIAVSSVKTTPTVKTASDAGLRVSKKFYAYVTERVTEACGLIGDVELLCKAMAAIDAYLADGIEPDSEAGTALLLIFNILRPEIDRAVSRSATARSRAASRRESAAGGESAMPQVAACNGGGDAPQEEVAVARPMNRRERRRKERDELRTTRRLMRRQQQGLRG